MSTHSPAPPDHPPMACPACGAPAARPVVGPCLSCGVDLTHPAVEGILELDRRWSEWATERNALMAQLLATKVQLPAPPETEGGQDVAAPDVAPAPAADPQRRLGVPTLLALAGVALLTTAAVVFTAVTWTRLPALGQAAILVAATAAAAAAALALRGSRAPTAAAALGVLTMSLAAVDVLGLQRAGLLALDEFTLPVAALVAGLVGWALSRAGLRWVSTAGALSWVIAAVGVTIAVAQAFTVPLALVMITGIVSAGLVALSALAWRTAPARWIASVSAVLLLTVYGLITAAGLVDDEVSLLAGLALLASVVVVLVAGARWSAATLAPTALLVLAAVVSTAADLGLVDHQLGAVTAATVAVIVWLATVVAPVRRWWLLAGALPAAVVVAVLAMVAGVDALGRMSAEVARVSWDPLDPWAAVTVVLVAGALLAAPTVRSVHGWVVVPTVMIASAALPVAVVWPLLLVLAILTLLLGDRLGWDPLLVLATAVVAVGWAAGVDWTLALAAAASAGLTLLLARDTDPVRAGLATGVALAAAGLAAGAAAAAVGQPLDVALGTALVVSWAGVVAVSVRGAPTLRLAGRVVAVLATLVVPVSSTSARAAGVLLLLAAAGWLVLAAAGWGTARWLAAVVTSTGVVVLLADAGVEVVEAYTLAPLLTLGAAGIWWLSEDGEVRTAPALTPALLVALLPSLVVLSADPRVLPRVLGLTAAAAVLAAAGVALRWLAPTVAGGLTALWVAATQLTIAVQLVQRWIAFAVAGILLVWLAATYERQRARTGRLAHHLGEMR